MPEVDLRRHLVFDLSGHVHLPTYLRYLLAFWCERGCPGELFLAVWPTLLHEHPDLLRLAAAAPYGRIHFVTPTRPQRQRRVALLESAGSQPGVTLAEVLRDGGTARYAAAYDWELLGRHAAALGATHTTLTHVDAYLPLLAAGTRAPGPWSGIYFGPTFHYGDFAGSPAGGPDAARALREKFVLARALRDPGLRTLFFLDPFAAARAATLNADRVRWLPDPVHLPAPDPRRVAMLRASLGVDPGRRVFLLFGHLTPRKGTGPLLEAVRLLPADLARRLCLMLVGRTDPGGAAPLLDAVADVRARTAVQVAADLRYVPHEDVPAYFCLADVVLAPYLEHAGMSGVLLLAAAAGRPVLATSYGLLGELTRRRGLGLAVDATRPAALAEGLARFLQEVPAALGDRDEMARLAREHDAGRFAALLLQRTEP